jgi:hypothetical protein
MAATISRCGNSIEAAGGIEPIVPVDGLPLMYAAFGSETPYGWLYLI